MAQYQIYAERDATIYEKKKNTNTGIDQILEIVSQKSGSILDEMYQSGTFNSRILIDFSGNELTNLFNDITSGTIGSTARKFYLNLKSVYASDNPIAYDIKAYPVSESWTNGTGNYADDPTTRDGVSWAHRSGFDGAVAWKTGSAHSQGTSAGREVPTGGGTWITGSGFEASQSFNYQSSDIRIDVSDIFEKFYENHLNAASGIPNHGLIIKLPYATEVNGDQNFNLKFFSKDTHTIYAPRLEVLWRDYQIADTSLTEVHQTDNGGPIAYFKNIEEKYPEGSVVQFRVGARSRFPVKTYSTSSRFTTTQQLSKTSSYAVCDGVTGETILDYDDLYTRISADSNGSYFNYRMNALSSERYYKFKIRSKYSDGTIKYFDNGYYFKVVR
tara:strand:+ start:8327 stop:9484 length:1158 start_codon:yes stop_codon:yes gene_type:complete